MLTKWQFSLRPATCHHSQLSLDFLVVAYLAASDGRGGPSVGGDLLDAMRMGEALKSQNFHEF